MDYSHFTPQNPRLSEETRHAIFQFSLQSIGGNRFRAVLATMRSEDHTMVYGYNGGKQYIKKITPAQYDSVVRQEQQRFLQEACEVVQTAGWSTDEQGMWVRA